MSGTVLRVLGFGLSAYGAAKSVNGRQSDRIITLASFVGAAASSQGDGQ